MTSSVASPSTEKVTLMLRIVTKTKFGVVDVRSGGGDLVFLREAVPPKTKNSCDYRETTEPGRLLSLARAANGGTVIDEGDLRAHELDDGGEVTASFWVAEDEGIFGFLCIFI
ncbi:hypothetical protein TIFTF001_030939 [Ficus carica]|uniref:Uncharacterized protein n=1 Tax=Ficus carica TaxID=3494 RepID=A0AA88DUH4_FICCA|nr:hypothetical protein TIFTF001_030939 [Ficus carica]